MSNITGVIISSGGKSETKNNMAPPSLDDYKLRFANDLRASIETSKVEQTLTAVRSTKRVMGNSSVTMYKHVKEVPFVEEVSNAVYSSVGLGSQQKSRRKINTLTSPQKTTSKERMKLTTVDSRISLGITAIECGHHGEKIKGLSFSIEKLRDELKIKDRFISRLLDGEENE